MTSRHVVNLIWVNYRRGTPIPTLLTSNKWLNFGGSRCGCMNF